MLLKSAILIYAGGAYAVAMINIAYLVGFLANIGVPKGINDGEVGALWPSIAINVLLIGLFSLHHSTTARRWFKARWTTVISPSTERATYLYMTAIMTAVLVGFWQPITITIWKVDTPIIAQTIIAIYLAVWGMMFSATFHFRHFGFFGLQQAWERIREQSPQPVPFCARWLYALTRHPISLGWMLTPWITPHMTVGQLVFAVGATIYVLAATPFEEADLIEEVGDKYLQYRDDVPPIVPGTKRNTKPKQLDPAE